MIVRLPSPTYVLGDLHGNYKDLLVFKQNFWNMGIDMTPSRFLFLGDYVDRGPHSLELSLSLFHFISSHFHFFSLFFHFLCIIFNLKYIYQHQILILIEIMIISCVFVRIKGDSSRKSDFIERKSRI